MSEVSEHGESVHAYFGLTYANYLVVPRTLMQSMPTEWQQRIVACLRELDDAFNHIDRPDYEVHACEWLAPYNMSEAVMASAGVTWTYANPDDPDDTAVVYHDRDGDELDPEIGRVPVPVREPVPHYNRGRAFVAPRTVRDE